MLNLTIYVKRKHLYNLSSCKFLLQDSKKGLNVILYLRMIIQDKHN